ncbi:MAG: hypothetical protein N3G80_00560 [Candidatus Micrarchaeota archaeon]|nr:hypothetical protein [Candidatus Micrarchaeota archaeon]
MKKNENYKPIGEGSGKEAIEELKNEIISPLENEIQKLRDPLVIAAIMHTAATEKENTNRILKTLVAQIEEKFAKIEARLDALEASIKKEPEEVLLPQVDEEIFKFVKEKGYVSAEDVRRRFGYKGKNAASSRLNRMYEMGLLSKKQVGRAVLYSAR